MTPSTDRLPVLFLSHGAPTLADDATWTRQLGEWGGKLPRPDNILVVSAHWENAPMTVSATENDPGLLYDFYGFPRHYYDVTYDAPQAPDLAAAVAQLTGTAENPLYRDESRGLDHGAYIPLKEMFPDADVPVLQLSMPTLDPQALFEIGRKLAPLRDNGTMIVGSGFTTHNFGLMSPDSDASAPAPTREFDQWAAEAMAAGDVDAILTSQRSAPGFKQAHPRSEHWAPLYVALGAADATGSVENTSMIDGFWHAMSKRSWQFV